MTKVGVWLRPKPPYFVSCLFELKDKKNFPKLIDKIRELQLQGSLVSKVHLINDTASKGVAVDDFNRQEELLRGYKIAPWSFAAGIYGSKAQVKEAMKQIKKSLRPLGHLEFVGDKKLQLVKMVGAMLRGINTIPGLVWMSDFITKRLIGKPLSLLELVGHVHSIEQGAPSDFFVKHAYLRSKVPKPKGDTFDLIRDKCGLVWLGPMVPMVGREMQNFVDMVEPHFTKYGFDLYVALMIGNPRTGIALLSVFYDKSDPVETKKAHDAYFELNEVVQKAGYQQYRTSTLYMSSIFKEAPEYLRFCKTIKKAIDPKNIIAPGKYGI